jgi:FSR family fosmidomycin resistance protein-like MFS transporter
LSDRSSPKLALAFASIAHSFSHMFVLFYATVVLVLEHEWGMSYAELFTLSIPGAVMFGVAALPAGWLGDRWSATGMIAVFFIGTGTASILTGLASGPYLLAAGLMAIGTFAAIFHPVGIPWLLSRARNKGRAMGISGVFGGIGTAAAALTAGGLAELLGWRAAFIVPGGAAILIGVAFIALRQLGYIGDGEETGSAPPAEPAADVKRAFAALAVSVVFVGVVYQAMSYALPKVFEERAVGLAEDGVIGIAGAVTLCYLIGGLTQLVGGELADRYSQKLVYAASHLLQIPLYLVGYVLLGPAMIPMAALMIAFNVLGQPVENTLLARYTPAKWRGRVFGAKFLLTLGVLSLGVAVVPVIHAATGNLDGLFVLLACSASVSFLAALALPGRRSAAVPLIVQTES